MSKEFVQAGLDGFKGSFLLLAAIFVAIIGTVSSFIDHKPLFDRHPKSSE